MLRIIFFTIQIKMQGQERSPNEHDSSHHSQIQAGQHRLLNKKQRKNAPGKKPTRAEGSNYYWSDRENRSYLKFLREKGMLLCQSAVERKRQKTNLKLSKYVKTRTPTQCHTHHQKMMVKYGSIERIVIEMTVKFERMEALRGRKITADVEEEAQQPKQAPCEEEGNKNTACLTDVQILKEQNDMQYIYY